MNQKSSLIQILKSVQRVLTSDILGDIIDRGPASIKAVDLAMRASELADVDDLHVLPGNHDLAILLVMSAPEMLEPWLASGGRTVLAEIGMSESTHAWGELTSKLVQVLHPDYLPMMTNGPTHVRLGDLMFVHAGVYPGREIDAFLALPRDFIAADDHWATIRYPFLNWEGGWDQMDADPHRRAARPTVIVHGHTPALRHDLQGAEGLRVCDGVDGYRTIALDIGAAFRRQLAWAHFRTRAGKAGVCIHAAYG